MFSKGGREVIVKEFKILFLGSIPINLAFVILIKEGSIP